MPLILTVFGFIFFLSISLFRYQPGENAYWIFAIPRYGSISRLPIIGLVWALTFIWPEYKRLSKLLKSFAGVAFIFFTVLILFLLSLQTVCAWKQSRFVQNSNERKYVSLYMASLGDEGALKLPRSIVGNNANLDVVLNFIKQHELNILSQGKPKSIFLQNFKKNRSLYISDSSSSVHSIQFDSTNGKWKQESTSVSIHNNRMIIENNRESPIVAKIVIQSEYYAPKALRIFETDPRIMKIVDVLNGTQAYYFSILSKKKINLVVFGNVRFYSASLKETFK
jgi:hypothetical protein